MSQIVYIGLHKSGAGSTFSQWNNFASLDFVRWNTGEPGGVANEDCAFIKEKMWDDYFCEKAAIYICEKNTTYEALTYMY